MIFGPCQEASFSVITLNPESNFTCRDKNHSLFQLKYIDVNRTTRTNLDVMLERRIDDHWNLDGSRDLSDPWTGFTQFTLLEEKPPDGYLWSGERLTRKQFTSRSDDLWPELCESMGKHVKLKKEKQKWSNEKRGSEKIRQNLRAFWKLMNPPECVWGILNRIIIMKTILQEKVRIHHSTTIWFTTLVLCLKL